MPVRFGESGRDPLNHRKMRPLLSRNLHIDARSDPASLILELPPDGAPLRWRHWTRHQGLPDHTLGPLALDAAGRLWLGSVSGPSRFDGL